MHVECRRLIALHYHLKRKCDVAHVAGCAINDVGAAMAISPAYRASRCLRLAVPTLAIVKIRDGAAARLVDVMRFRSHGGHIISCWYKGRQLASGES